MEEKVYPCCDPSSPSPIWAGKPTGKIITVHGIETYFAQPSTRETDPRTQEPTDQKRVILHLTEGHSMYFINAQLLADSFAQHLKCDVIMPDLFAGKERVPKGQLPSFPSGKVVIQPDGQGTPPPPYFLSEFTPQKLETWEKTFQPHVTDPIIAKIVQHIHSTYGADVKIGGVGYCFGGRYVMRLMGSGVLDVGVVNHPSFFTMDEVGKLGNGQRLAMFAAETDDILPADKRRATEDVLMKGGVTWMSTVFSGTAHGFAVRGDLSKKEVRKAKEKAFRGAVEWFEDWL